VVVLLLVAHRLEGAGLAIPLVVAARAIHPVAAVTRPAVADRVTRPAEADRVTHPAAVAIHLDTEHLKAPRAMHRPVVVIRPGAVCPARPRLRKNRTR
jgi:hypothetical protein